MDNIDFTKGVDLTGVATIDAAAINSLFEDGSPKNDTAGVEGKGLVLWNVDSAPSTPVEVPNPLASAAYTKWKRYIWVRIPFILAPSQQPIIYIWNDNVVSGALLKWVEVSTDVTAIYAAIAATDAVADSAKATADSLWTQINGAGGVAIRLTVAEKNIQALQNTGWKKFTSTTKTILRDDSSTIILEENHGLPGTPQVLNLTLVCTADDIGYTAGDEVNALSASVSPDPNMCPFTIKATATKIGVYAYWYVRESTTASRFYMARGDNTAGSTIVDQTKWSIRATAIYFA